MKIDVASLNKMLGDSVILQKLASDVDLWQCCEYLQLKATMYQGTLILPDIIVGIGSFINQLFSIPPGIDVFFNFPNIIKFANNIVQQLIDDYFILSLGIVTGRYDVLCVIGTKETL